MAAEDLYAHLAGFVQVFPVSTAHLQVGYMQRQSDDSTGTWPPEDDPLSFSIQFHVADIPEIPDGGVNYPDAFYDDDFQLGQVGAGNVAGQNLNHNVWMFWDLSGLPDAPIERAELIVNMDTGNADDDRVLSGYWRHRYTTNEDGIAPSRDDHRTGPSGPLAFRMRHADILTVNEEEQANPFPDLFVPDAQAPASGWFQERFAIPLQNVDLLARRGLHGMYLVLGSEIPNLNQSINITYSIDTLLNGDGDLFARGFNVPALRLWFGRAGVEIEASGSMQLSGTAAIRTRPAEPWNHRARQARDRRS